MSQNSARNTWKEEELQKLLRDIMTDIHDRCAEYGRAPGGIERRALGNSGSCGCGISLAWGFPSHVFKTRPATASSLAAIAGSRASGAVMMAVSRA